jgi:hypothetical protein
MSTLSSARPLSVFCADSTPRNLDGPGGARFYDRTAIADFRRTPGLHDPEGNDGHPEAEFSSPRVRFTTCLQKPVKRIVREGPTSEASTAARGKRSSKYALSKNT